MARTSYVVALGSNRRGRHGSPRAEIAAALTAIGGVTAVSPIMTTPPLGPSIRRFANMVAIIESDDDPPALLRRLKAIEHARSEAHTSELQSLMRISYYVFFL